MPDEFDGLDPRADQLGNLLVRLHRLRDRSRSELDRKNQRDRADTDGLDVAALICLFRLISGGPMRLGALAEAVYSDPSTVSRQVTQLVTQGYLKRWPDAADGRATVLVPTDAGRAVAARLRRRRNETLSRVIADWSDSDRSDLVRLLGSFVDSYEHQHGESFGHSSPSRTASPETVTHSTGGAPERKAE